MQSHKNAVSSKRQTDTQTYASADSGYGARRISTHHAFKQEAEGASDEKNEVVDEGGEKDFQTR